MDPTDVQNRLTGRVLHRLGSAMLATVAFLALACASEPSGDRGSTTPTTQQTQPQQSEVAPDIPTNPFKLGFLLDFSGPLAEYGPELRRGFELAIKHINEAGGVWGMPVETAIGDTAQDPTVAVEEARRLIEIEGVHGIVGPMSSAMTLAVAESVSGPASIPTISPVATSSQITLADDDDFLFRVSLADRIEGQYLAQLAAAEGFENVGLLYRDDAFGQGMAASFVAHWTGTITSIGIDPGATSFTAELEQSIEFDPEALVLITFPPESIQILREALELGYYERFVFGASVKTPTVSDAIGAAPLAGMRGTFVAPAPENASSAAWTKAFLAEYGELPNRPYVKEAYDATIALALAAQAASSSDGALIRDQLRSVGSAPGLLVIPDPDSLSAGLAATAEGDDVDYEGAAGTVDWDEHGDSTRGYIGTWEFAEDGSITDLEVFEFVAN